MHVHAWSDARTMRWMPHRLLNAGEPNMARTWPREIESSIFMNDPERRQGELVPTYTLSLCTLQGRSNSRFLRK